GGVGGASNNGDGLAPLRDTPGRVAAGAARPDDAGPLLRTCLAAATVDGQVSVFLEPIALYHERDLLVPGDRGWLGNYRAADHVPIGTPPPPTPARPLTVPPLRHAPPLNPR